MKISRIHIKNFRSIKDCEILLDPYTALVGPNGAGKSTVLCALNIFFRETEATSTNTSELDIEDFHNKNTADPIEITVTFDDLSISAKQDFAEYVRHDQLVITAKAVFNADSGFASVRQYGQRSAMEAFAEFFKLYNDGGSVASLKTKYAEIKSQYTDLESASTKDAMRETLRKYEDQHPENCVLIPSEDRFYGFSKGGDRLARHVQWIYVPAVKDATTENAESKGSALGKILARAVRAKVNFEEEIQKIKDDTLNRYRELIGGHQNALNEISEALTTRLRQWAHPGTKARVEWVEDARKAVQIEEPTARLFAGEGAFEGEIARFGHGLQRSYLLALLQELAAADDSAAPTLILGCEEPELYQHPPQARHLSTVLQQLSDGNAQVVLTTHSPYFVAGMSFENVRMVRCDTAAKLSRISATRFSDIASRLSAVTGEKQNAPNAQAARLHQALQVQLNEMFFTPRLILVEGLEDIGFLTTWLLLSGRIEAFRKAGCHIVAANGKDKLIEPLIIAQAFSIPCFVIFDSDGNLPPEKRPPHARDNKAILSIMGGNIEELFPSQIVWNKSFIQWPINFGSSVRADVDSNVWDKAYGLATKGLGTPEGNFSKNITHIGDHLQILKDQGIIPACLDKACDLIINFAEQP